MMTQNLSRILFIPKFFSLLFLYFLISVTINLEAKFSLGVDYLEETKFDILKGKKIGLLTHPAGVNSRGISTVDVLRSSSQVDLVALFGPEHGIYGNEKAAVPVEDKIDQKTGLPVYSLYGKFRKPTPSMLSKIDCMVIDLQDVGVRCYTYISCMRYAMEACFEEEVQVVVLDRPNPLGGQKMAGPMIDEKWMSYVGAFPMPFVHAMTIGEIALWSKKESGILKISEKARKSGQLAIVPMKNWKRAMTWPQTGLKWIPTSPNIPTLDSVAGYPMTGLGAQMGKFKHGIGTPQPFRFLTFDGISPADLKTELDNLNISGLSFQLKTLKNNSGKDIEGVYIVLTDWSKWRPTELAFYMMQLSAKWEAPSPFTQAKESEVTLFNKHVGSSAWWNHLFQSGASCEPRKFLIKWDGETRSFKDKVSKYYLY
jgi:uncharacterized protein YbbC (DUF1343 family)